MSYSDQKYYCKYNGDEGMYCGVHSDELQEYHVIHFTTGLYAGHCMLCCDTLPLEWIGAEPVEKQTVMFASEMATYMAF